MKPPKIDANQLGEVSGSLGTLVALSIAMNPSLEARAKALLMLRRLAAEPAEVVGQLRHEVFQQVLTSVEGLLGMQSANDPFDGG